MLDGKYVYSYSDGDIAFEWSPDSKWLLSTYMAGDKSIPQLAVEFNVAKSSVSKWVNEYKEECLYTTSTITESNDAKEIRRLNQLLNEKDKEIAFLKKTAAFFAKEID